MTHTRRAFISIVGAFAIGIGSVVRLGEADQKPLGQESKPIYRTDHTFTTKRNGHPIGWRVLQADGGTMSISRVAAAEVPSGSMVYISQRTEVSYDNGNTWVETDQEHAPRET